MQNRNTNYKFLIFWLFELIICLVISFSLTHYLRSETQKAETWVRHTRAVINKLDEVTISVISCETAIRGYIISEDQDFLQFYDYSKTNIQSDLFELGALVNDNPKQKQHFLILQELITAKVQHLGEFKQIKDERGIQAVREEMFRTESKKKMVAIRYVSEEMHKNENILLQKRLEYYRIKSNNLSLSIPAVIIGNFLMLMVVYYFLQNIEAEAEEAKTV